MNAKRSRSLWSELTNVHSNNMANKKIIGIIAAVVVVVAAAALLGAVLIGATGTPSQASREAAASSTVATFGTLLQQVSLLSPDASSTIATTYAPYVDPSLLKQWEANPQSAPGRVVSSPWPDHIVIATTTPQGAGYVVSGELVFMTSNNVEHGGYDSEVPAGAQLQNENGRWMIVAFQKQTTQTP